MESHCFLMMLAMSLHVFKMEHLIPFVIGLDGHITRYLSTRLMPMLLIRIGHHLVERILTGMYSDLQKHFF
ncbi:hypothetical protein D3C78_1831520 [compost metagenome]